MTYKNIIFLILVGCLFLGFVALEAEANIVIKVRALNPLESQEVASIRYPLPREITPDDIVEQDIIFSLPPEEGAEPRKTTFHIEYVVEEGRYYIIDEVMMGPREVVTLEARVRDIWTIPEERFNSIKQDVEEMIAQFAPADPAEQNSGTAAADATATPEAESVPGDDEQNSVTAEDGDEEPSAEETETPSTTVLMLQKEIFANLDRIAERQAKNSVLLVGVEKHMEAYYENMEGLSQVQTDVIILKNLLEPEEEEGEETEPIAEEAADIAPDGQSPDENIEILEGIDLQADPAAGNADNATGEMESILSE